jgi:phosphopantothenoylcysteine decarboxylase/phosphopantothenate--cysteine ligase
MRVLITAGPTHEPIDPVRFIGNRSSGKGGAALATAAIKASHEVTLIVGPVSAQMPTVARRIDVQTAAEMLAVTLKEFEDHDLLILAAAVSDFRPKVVHQDKLARHGTLIIECEATEDIAAAAGRIKRPHQRTVGFSLQSEGNLQRAREKLLVKKLDLIVFNPATTIGNDNIEPVLIYPDGRTEPFALASKGDFADILIQRAMGLWNPKE